MAGKIVADQLEHSTAGSVDTQYVVNGSAKAWVDKPANGASINDSFNVSTLDDDGTGDFGLNFTSSLSSANYSVSGMADDGASSGSAINIDTTSGTNASGSIDLETYYVSSVSNRTNNDNRGYVAIHGDLA